MVNFFKLINNRYNGAIVDEVNKEDATHVIVDEDEKIVRIINYLYNQ